MGQVVVIGETAVDVLVACEPGMPVWGQVESEVSDVRLSMGSSGAITAAALAVLGQPVAFVGVVGDDHLGQFFREELSRHGVDVSELHSLPGGRTGITVALERDGDRAMLTFPGTMSVLSTSDVPATVVSRAKHVHVSSYFLQRGLQRGLAALFARARSSGATTSLDPGWDGDNEWDAGLGDVLAHVDWFFPNEAEARSIADRLAPGIGVHEPSVAAEVLRELVAGAVVVKRGALGAMILKREEILELVTEPLTPLDTTGAGDNFDAGFLAAMLEGRDTRGAMALGVACGRHSILGRGGTGRLAQRFEADAAARDLVGLVTSRHASDEPRIKGVDQSLWTHP